MIVCDRCGKEIDGDENFCPYCAAPVAAADAGDYADESRRQETGASSSSGLQRHAQAGRGAFLEESDLEPPTAVPLASFGERRETDDRAQRKLFVVVGAASVALVGLLALLLATSAGRSWIAGLSGPPQPDRLAGALRPGSPEFEQLGKGIIVDFDADEHASQSSRPLGDVIIDMKPTIRNLTGRTINGLELRAAGYDLEGQVVKERTFLVIPKRQSQLEPNKTMTPSLLIEGVNPNNVPASLKMEVTGVTFK